MIYFYDRYLMLNQIRSGASIQVRDNKPFRQYLNREGIFDNLLADDASQRTGVAQLTANLYSAITNYFMEKVWSDKPEGTVVNSNFVEQFVKATFYRSLYGYGVVAYIDGRWEAIDSRFWWPILQRGTKIGSALVFPYQSNRDAFFNQQASTLGNSIPDRAWTTVILDNVSRGIIRDFEYSGITLGRVIGRSQINDLKIVVFGNGTSDYNQTEPLVLKYNELIDATSDIVQRFSKPHMQVPASAVRTNENGQYILDLDSEGSVLPVNRDDKDWKYLTLQADVNVFEFQARQLLGMISAITSVPMASFNIHGLPRLESGEGVQALEAPANSKVAQWRQEIVEAVSFAGFQLNWETAENNSQQTEDINDG